MKKQKVCKDLEKDLILYYYGDCSVEEQERVEIHLKGCPSCSRFLTDLRTFLPLTIESDEPPQAFWEGYSREMRKKLAAVEEKGSWWEGLFSFFRPWPVPALATALVLALAVTFTLTRDMRRSQERPPDEEALREILPIAENLDFFKAMDFLDSIDFLEALEGQRIQRSETNKQVL